LDRVDHQVKIRGQRVEPGWVETALAGHPCVRAAVVTARERDDGDRILVAYLTADGDLPPVAGLRGFLLERMPDYQVPQAFVRLAEIPLNSNGKVDRAALPAPAAADFGQR